MQQEKPLKQIRLEVVETEGKASTQTNFARADFLKQVIGELPEEGQDILIVGAGFADDVTQSSYVPFIALAQANQSLRSDFRISILDIDPRVHDLADTSHMFLVKRPAMKSQAVYSSFIDYQNLTGLQSIDVAQGSDLYEKFLEQADLGYTQQSQAFRRYGGTIEDFLIEQEGIMALPVPPTIKDLAEEKRFETIQADITSAQDLGENYSLIDMENVLVHLSTEQQQQAVSNCLNLLRPGGLLIIDDNRLRTNRNCIFNLHSASEDMLENGGWLDQTWLNEYGMEVVQLHVPRKESYYTKVLLRKK